MKAREPDEVDGGHRLTGEWTLASGSRHADLARSDGSGARQEAASRLATLPDAAAASSAGAGRRVEWIDNWNSIGLKATNSGGFRFTDQFVPPAIRSTRDHLAEVAIAGSPLQVSTGTPVRHRLLGRRARHRALDAGCRHRRCEAEAPLARQAIAAGGSISAIPDRRGGALAALRRAAHVEATADRVWQGASSPSGELTVPQRMDNPLCRDASRSHEASAVADARLADRWRQRHLSPRVRSSARCGRISTVMQQPQGRKSHLQDVGAWMLGLAPNFAAYA